MAQRLTPRLALALVQLDETLSRITELVALGRETVVDPLDEEPPA